MGSLVEGEKDDGKKPAWKNRKPVRCVGEQDIHQTVVIGVDAIAAHNAQADSMMDDILAFVEENVEAEILSVEREIR